MNTAVQCVALLVGVVAIVALSLEIAERLHTWAISPPHERLGTMAKGAKS